MKYILVVSIFTLFVPVLILFNLNKTRLAFYNVWCLNGIIELKYIICLFLVLVRNRKYYVIT